LAIGNHLKVTPQMYTLYKDRASKERQIAVSAEDRGRTPSFATHDIAGSRDDCFEVHKAALSL